MSAAAKTQKKGKMPKLSETAAFSTAGRIVKSNATVTCKIGWRATAKLC